VVITGLSGSGKSSLAFDTIYAEGQRRYVESLSAYARQFLELMQKPDVDLITGLSPAISIEQKTTSRNPRSTVATVTEIYDYMRLLWARVGRALLAGDGAADRGADRVADGRQGAGDAEGSRLYLLRPIVRGRKGEYRKEFAELLRQGFQRVKVDGELYELDEVPALNKKVKHEIEVVVDRLVTAPDLAQQRLADSIETALKLSDGLLVVENAETASGRRSRPSSPARSRASPCRRSSPAVLVQQPLRRLPGLRRARQEDADGPGPGGAGPGQVGGRGRGRALGVADHAVLPADAGLDLPPLRRRHRTPWRELPQKVRDVILYGSGEERVRIELEDGLRRFESNKPFEGVVNNLQRRWRETESAWMREELSRYMSATTCEACGGTRLKPEALSVKIAGRHISEVTELAIDDAAEWFGSLREKLTPKQQDIAARVLKEVCERLGFLNNVGLTYLTLARDSGTLSGGESQRIRLASQIGSGPHRRALRAGRALDRAAPARQRPAAGDAQEPARPRQHGDRGRARRGRDPHGRLPDRHGAGGGRPRRAGGGRGHAREVMREPASLTGQYLAGIRAVPLPASGAAPARRGGSRSPAAGRTTSRASPAASRSAASCA
jgi:excinuclease ABC subunit A